MTLVFEREVNPVLLGDPPLKPRPPLLLKIRTSLSETDARRLYIAGTAEPCASLPDAKRYLVCQDKLQNVDF